MTSNEHLQHLLEVRGALLREVARLNVAITKERMHAQDLTSRDTTGLSRHDVLSWKEALHQAKIPQVPESVAMHA